MNKRNLLNLGLLAVIAVLVLLAVYEPGIEQPTPVPTLLQLDKDAIQRIAIQRDGQDDLLLVKEEGNWWMEQPVRHPADPLRMESLLRITTLKSQSSFSAEEEKLASYQLDKPQVMVTYNDAVTLAFGSSTPLDHRRYILADGRVHLTTDSYYYHLIGGFATYLRRQLLDDGSSIESIKLPKLSVAWQESGWLLNPRPESYSADQVTQLIDNWKLASALEIKPYDKQAGERVEIKLGGVEQPIELLLTARTPDLVLARPELGVQYHFDASSADALLQLPELQEEDAGEIEDAAEADSEDTHAH